MSWVQHLSEPFKLSSKENAIEKFGRSNDAIALGVSFARSGL
jgi:hypothetical protein